MEMIKTEISIDPLTRIEGHLKIEVEVEDQTVIEARTSGTLYRGFEQILVGRNPLDAVQITQRFCGVCPTPHAIASAQALDNAFGIVPPDNGRLIRNIMQGANSMQSHILHFYHLASLDYFRGPEIPPFVPRYEADYRVPDSVNKEMTEHYIEAYHIRLKSHELCAIWSGKMPHMASIVPGGVTINPRIDNITTSLWRLKELSEFIDTIYIPDVITLGKVYRDYFKIGIGPQNHLTYGQFDLDSEPDVTKRKRLLPMGRLTAGKLEKLNPAKITEDINSSWYSSASHLHPEKGETIPDPYKTKAYTWLKAPRYDNKVYEVGPLSRMLVAYHSQENPKLIKLIDDTIKTLQIELNDLNSVMGRHVMRALECKIIADSLTDMIMAVKLDESVCTDYEAPKQTKGMGLWDAARGALGHWIEIKNEGIARYQAVVPTTWNASPKDDKGQPGPIETAMLGTKVEDSDNPFALARIVRSYDPCIACAVHLLHSDNTVKRYRIN